MSVATIRNLLVLVLVISIDSALVHDYLGDSSHFPYLYWPILFRLAFAGSILMLSTVVLTGSMALPGRGHGKPFLIGFTLSGAFAIFALLGLALVVPWEWFIQLYREVHQFSYIYYYKYLNKLRIRDFQLLVDLLLFTAIFTSPQLLIGVTGGFFARRFAASRVRTPSPGNADAFITRS
jgi:hypothetical protein